MKTQVVVAVVGLFVVVLAGARSSIADESKEYCRLVFKITGAEVDVKIFDESFVKGKTSWFNKSGCGLDSTQSLPDGRVMKTYICSQPNSKVISDATRSFEIILTEDNANRRERERPKKHGLLNDQPRLASIDDPASVLAQDEAGSPEVDFAVTAATCICGTSGPCTGGGIKCSKQHPTCPAC